MIFVFIFQKLLLYIFTFSLIFPCIKSGHETVIINLDNNDITSDYNESKSFYINITNVHLKRNYIKVEIKGKTIYNDYSISYFKDEYSFKNNSRNQLSQSFSGKAFMWLNKEQMNHNFYLTIECLRNPCEYTFNLIYEENMTLSLGESYTYYVTNETEEMNFIIQGNQSQGNLTVYEENENNCKISIWAKGNKEINSELQGDYFNKNKNGFNAYLVKNINIQKINYKFTVFGQKGDLINIGALMFNERNISQTPLNNFGIEIIGIFKRDFMEKICFLISNENINENDNIFNLIYDYNSSVFTSELVFDPNFSKDNNYYKLYCSHMDNYADEYFYSFQYNSKNNYDKDTIIIFPPLNLGTVHHNKMKKGDRIGFIPIKPDQKFNYLKYETTKIKGDYKASILSCHTYPFCQTNANNNSELSLLEYFSSSIIYTNNEYDNDITPISKKQKILLLKCESDNCENLNSLYMNGNNVTLLPNIPYHKFIKKNMEEYFIINLNNYFDNKNQNITMHINIETLSGNIKGKLYLNNTKISSYRKFRRIRYFKTYYVKAEYSREYTLKINALSNSAYSIVINIEKESNNPEIVIMPQMNYRFKFQNYENFILSDLMTDNNKDLYYFGLSPEDCKIEVNNLLNNNEQRKVIEVNKTYQDFFYINNNEQTINNQINIIKADNNEKICHLDLFLYEYKNLNGDLNSIILPPNSSHIFIFNSIYKEVNYMFLHSELEKNVNIKIRLVDKINIIMSLFLNETKYQEYSFNKDKPIELPISKIKKVCNNDIQLCKINIILKTNNNINNTEIEININTRGNYHEDKFKYILYSAAGCVFLIIIIVIIIIVIKNKKSANKLKEQVNAISFSTEDLLDEEK